MKLRIFSLLFCATILSNPTLLADDGIYTFSTQTYVDVPIHYHFVTAINPYDRYIELEDESRWKIPEYDVYGLQRWSLGQFVVVTPNCRWFSDYNYYLTNQANGAYLSANLLRGPLHTSKLAHHISGMEQNTRGRKTIILDGKTCWAISEEHHYIADGWQINDTIIIGQNDSWLSRYDTILINVETNSFAKARKI